jgi:hypothetical protein
VKAYPHEKLAAWLDGVQSGLSFFGGVSAQVMYYAALPPGCGGCQTQAHIPRANAEVAL